MSLPDRLVLVGPMGAGKTAVGRRLARLLRYRFHDSDAEVEKRTGVDISFIFEKEGEAGFRRREQTAIDDLTHLGEVVLATGGGAVTNENNRRILAERCYVIYLTASVDQQLARTSRNRDRPLLQTSDPRARLEALMQEREPYYLALADHSVDTDNCRVDAVARALRDHLHRQPLDSSQ